MTVKEVLIDDCTKHGIIFNFTDEKTGKLKTGIVRKGQYKEGMFKEGYIPSYRCLTRKERRTL
jgi:hypothetical protein